MNLLREVDQLPYTNPAWQNGYIGNKTNIFHQSSTFPARIFTQYEEFTIKGDQAEYGL